MKSFKRFIPALALAAIVILATATPLLAGKTPVYTYKVVAWNDLGMHCACPSFQGFLLLPPFNTVRTQVLAIGGRDPIVVDPAFATANGLTIGYSMIDNTDANLIPDAYFSQWITYAPKLFPPNTVIPTSPYYPPIDPVDGRVQSPLSKAKLSGIFTSANYDSDLLDWKAVGIPAYPIASANSSLNIMIDPLGGPNRNPYPMTNVYVKNSSGAVVAQTNTVTPVAFGGCCGCHLDLAAQNGYPRTPAGSFAYIGKMHGQNSSKIDFNYLDPDGDGVAGPVRCSVCHWDPAMGEKVAPGFSADLFPNLQILPGANFGPSDVHPSTHSFSDVLHSFHVNSSAVKLMDPGISTDCYKCHPGNGVNCYRGTHTTKTGTGTTPIWCSDCHGTLVQRDQTGQMTAPWKASTLPSCTGPAQGPNGSIPPSSVFPCHAARTVGGTTYPTTQEPDLFGKFINSRGHKGSIKCQTCHGSAHAEAPATPIPPATTSLDNIQLQTLQGSVSPSTNWNGKNSSYALGVCQVCHPGKTADYGVPPHN